jgi:hypothetical protein
MINQLYQAQQKQIDNNEYQDYEDLLKESIESEKAECTRRKMEERHKDTVINCSEMNHEQLNDALSKKSHLEIYQFLIRINWNQETPSYFTIYEIKNNMHYSIHSRDIRFKEADCIWNFHKSSNKKETMIEIIRWLQMTGRCGNIFF